MNCLEEPQFPRRGDWRKPLVDQNIDRVGMVHREQPQLPPPATQAPGSGPSGHRAEDVSSFLRFSQEKGTSLKAPAWIWKWVDDVSPKSKPASATGLKFSVNCWSSAIDEA